MTDFAEIAALKVMIDSSDVKSGVAELDKLTKSGGAAEQASNALGAAWGKADVALTKLGQATAEAKAEIDQYKASLKAGTISQSEFEASVLKTKTALASIQNDTSGVVAEYERMRRGLDGVSGATGNTRIAQMELMHVIRGSVDQFAAGASPIQIFTMHLGMAAQAASMAGGAMGAVGEFLAGPWGMAVVGAATVAGVLIGKMLDTADAADKVRLSSDAMGEAQKALGGVFDLTTGKMNVQTGAALALAKAQIILAQATAQKNLAEARGQIADSAAKQWEISGGLGGGLSIGRTTPITAQVESQFRNGVIDANGAIETLRRYQQAGRITAETFTQLSAAYANTAVEQQNLKTLHEAETSLLTGKLDPALMRHTKTHEAHRAAVSDSEKAQLRWNKAQQEMNDIILRGNGLIEERIAKMGATLDDKLAKYLAMPQLTDDRTLAEKSFDSINAAVDKIRQDAGATFVDWAPSLDKTLERLKRIGSAMGMFGVSGAAGAALSTLWSTPAGVAQVNGKDQIVTLGDRIERIFTKDGKFGTTMKDLLQGAGTGLAIGSLIFGPNASGGQQVGSAVGGALGEAAGKSLTKGLTGFLGNLGGPLGAVLGGIVGGLIGGLFSSKPHAEGNITNNGTTVTGNNDQAKAGLSSFGLGVNQAVSKIADQLGGSVGSYSVGIGKYKDYFQVAKVANAPGLGHAHYWSDHPDTVAYDGLDEAAALRAAISVAIEQGAIQGIRAGTQTLLKAGTDIEAQLAKAMKFEGVFNDLKQATDPLGYALDQVTKKFDDLRKIFAEAGASAADYAQLEQLLAIQRQDAIAQARKDAVGKVSDPLNMQIQILDLLGDKEHSLAASRLMEIAQLKDSLQPMQAMIYTLQDARAVIDKFTPLRDDLEKFKQELLGGDATGSYGSLTAQFRATALAAANGDATAMGGLRQVTNDWLAAAKDNASSATEYQRAVSEALQAVDKAHFAADATIDYAQAQIEATVNVANLLTDMKAEIASFQSQITENTGLTYRMLQRFEGDGLTVKTDTDTPLQVQVV